jgi:hypothetical protein
MIKLRSSIFETNSSATHSFSVIVGEYTSIVCYSEEEQDDVYLSNADIREILSDLPTEMLESELLKRSKQ